MTLATEHQRRRFGLSGRNRSAAYGRLYTVAGGAPNRPLVVLAADAVWTLSDDTSWPQMLPQSLNFTRGFSRVGDATAAADWIEKDVEIWTTEGQKVKVRRNRRPILVVVETSQAPHIFRLFEDRFRDVENYRTAGFRLRTGDQNILEARTFEMHSGARDVGGNWLASWFDSTVPAEPPTDERNGRPYAPGHTAISFADWESEDAPGFSAPSLRSGLSAATSLRAKARNGDDLSMALSDDETKAGALMIATLSMSHNCPHIKPPQDGEDGWGQYPSSMPLRRGLSGIA